MPSKTASFPDYIRSNLQNNNYKCTMQSQAGDVFMQTPAGESVWIAYLSQEWTVEQIRRCFEFKGHVLLVVDDKLIPQEITDRQSTPMWLRTLHGLYMGRIYTWNGRYLYGLHFDYDTGDISESGIIQPDELLLIETGTWLRGWTGEYKLARFYDKAWWAENAESFHDQYTRYKQQREQQYRRGNKQSYGYYGGTGSNPPKQDATGGRDFGKEFRACNDLMAVKALYRKLAREFHPDLDQENKTKAEIAERVVIMQQIIDAYDRAKMVYA